MNNAAVTIAKIPPKNFMFSELSKNYYKSEN